LVIIIGFSLIFQGGFYLLITENRVFSLNIGRVPGSGLVIRNEESGYFLGRVGFGIGEELGDIYFFLGRVPE
jgi:hypothetical protein